MQSPLKEPDRPAYTILERILRPLLTLVYRVKIVGGEHVPSTGPCVLAANHASVLDGFFLALATRRQVRFMAKEELYRLSVIRTILHAAGAFPVDRRGDAGRAVARGVELLDQGAVIGVFPEGTAITDRKKGYRRGAARLALASGAPLVPVALIDTERSIEPRTHRIGFPRVTIVIGQAIPVERQEPTEEAATELTARLKRAIESLAQTG
jgi:1-acyl-sn-glycerol-3-phosphate acyltransferase